MLSGEIRRAERVLRKVLCNSCALDEEQVEENILNVILYINFQWNWKYLIRRRESELNKKIDGEEKGKESDQHSQKRSIGGLIT